MYNSKSYENEIKGLSLWLPVVQAVISFYARGLGLEVGGSVHAVGAFSQQLEALRVRHLK